MTDKLQKMNHEIEQAIKDKNFDRVYNLLLDEYSEIDLLIFYKKQQKTKIPIFSLDSFWRSQLPCFHLKFILESDLKIKFIESYLEGAKNCNHELNRNLIELSKKDFIKYFKLCKAFEKDTFFNSLEKIAFHDTELKPIIKELEIIIKAQKKIKEEEEIDKDFFLQYKFGEIALIFTQFLEDTKEKLHDNWSRETEITTALIEELTGIIKIFQNAKNAKKTLQIDVSEFNQEQLKDRISSLYSYINTLIERNIRKCQIEIYLSGYSDFKAIFLNPAHVETNQQFKAFKINDKKKGIEEFYFNSDKKLISDPTSEINNLKFYGVPEIIDFNGAKIDLNKVIKLLLDFSFYKGPHYINVQHHGNIEFKTLFGNNNSMSIFEIDEFTDNIVKYYGWEVEETKSIIEFLQFDISINKPFYKLFATPFLKFNNQILWLGSFLRDRRWANIILNKLKLQKEKEKELAINFELEIEKKFESKSFNTRSKLKFSSSNGESGEFDVLAYKDNHLFVCEAKSGYRSDDFTYSALLETVRLEGCAAEQLEKGKRYIDENWEDVKLKLDINETIELSSLKIFPLIITDYFDGDLKLYKDLHKITLLELDVLLNNRKKDLLERYLNHQQLINANDNNLKQKTDNSIEWDLWNGKSDFEVEGLINNIKNNAIWKELESIWKFEPISYQIDY